jgi:hypothetical protein
MLPHFGARVQGYHGTISRESNHPPPPTSQWEGARRTMNQPSRSKQVLNWVDSVVFTATDLGEFNCSLGYSHRLE